MNKFFILILSLFLVSLSLVNFVSAVECNADLSQGGDSCTVSSSLTLNGSYVVNMNGSFGNAIRINANNLIFDCNGTTIYGNWSAGASSDNSRGISFNVNRQNVTIKNCNVNNYWASFRTRSDFNVSFINVTSNGSFYGFDWELTNNTNIYNSTITNFLSVGIYVTNSQNNIFDNVNISTITQQKYLGWFDSGSINNVVSNSFFDNGFFRINGNYNNITLSRFINGNKTYDYGSIFISGSTSEGNRVFGNILIGNASKISIEGGNNTFIYNNSIYNITQMSHCIGALIGSKNFNIYNNYMDNCDIGILVSKVSGNNQIYNNTILNCFNHMDGYDAGIFFELGRTANVLVYGNNITNFGTVGIGLKNVTNATIYNNYISGLTNRENRGYWDYRIPQTGIGLYESYKGFSGEGLATEGWNDTNWDNYKNKNINIYGNTIVNVASQLYSVGTINLIQDISNFWFRSFKNNYEGLYQIWGSNSFSNLTRIDSNYLLTDVMQVCSLSNCSLNYIEYQSYSKYTNNQPNVQVFSKYNLTSALLTNGTSICNGSSSNLALNTGNINIILQPNEACWVLDNFNCSEQQQSLTGNPCGRENSPINISNKTTNGNIVTYHITNILTDNITITFSLINCSNSTVPVITPKNTNPYLSQNYSCSGNYLTIYDINLSYSNDSNLITLYTGDLLVSYTYTYNSQEQNGYPQSTAFISSSLLRMVYNFFAISPIIGTIMGVSILIVGLIILVQYIKRFNKDNDTTSFQG